METLIEIFCIFCVLAFKYWYLFIPVMVILTIAAINEK